MRLATTFNGLTPPAEGAAIGWHGAEERLEVPARPIVAFIEGDGIGPDIWRATRRVLDGAVAKVYDGQRAIAWFEVLAGEKAKDATGGEASRGVPAAPGGAGATRGWRLARPRELPAALGLAENGENGENGEGGEHGGTVGDGGRA